MKVRSLKYEKGELYAPDSMDDLPTITNKYFYPEFKAWGRGIYEYGTCRCIKSFEIEITITIKEI